MRTHTKTRTKTQAPPGWSKKPITWTNDRTGDAFLSVVFTWDLPEAHTTAAWLAASGYHVHAGGPAVRLMPEYLAEVADLTLQDADALSRHHPHATVTTRGCPNRCPFCAVPIVEGAFRELTHWTPRPIVCDSNLLACSRHHFDRVIDRLKLLGTPIDINQGLDHRLLTNAHADRLAELDCKARLSLDHTRHISTFMRAFRHLRHAGLTKKAIRVYVLIGYDDTPADALHRLRLVQDLGLTPYPMRYNPLDTLQRDSYVGPRWTDRELHRYMRYWTRLRYFGGIPFEDFDG